LTDYGYSYGECVAGLAAMQPTITSRFRKVRLISWGVNVWYALEKHVLGYTKRRTLSQLAEQTPGKVLVLDLGSSSFEYLPIMHPSF
jgi:hypothetical protein